MKQKHLTRTLVLLLSGLAFTGCAQTSNKAPEFALLSLFSNQSGAAFENSEHSYIITSSDPATTGCKINVTTINAPGTPGSVNPGQVLTFEMEGADSTHLENAGFIGGLSKSVGDLPATHSIIAPDVTTKYVLSIFTVDGVRTRHNNCEVTVNVIPTGTSTAPLPSCELKADTIVAAYGDPLSLSWTSQNAVTAEIYPTNAVGVIAAPEVAAGNWSYKSYYGRDFSMKVWNADGVWTQCFANIKEDVNDNAPPVANDSGYTINASGTITGTLNGTDLENDSLSYSIKTLPNQGTVNLSNATTGAFTYTANSGATGFDSFTLAANDGKSDSNIATVRIQFKAVIQPQISAGGTHTCALLETGMVRCWGDNRKGQLGYAHTIYIGDNETPADAGHVDVGGTVKQIATGKNHSCALLETGKVRCWGENSNGQLGYGHTQNIGDNESPASAGDIDLGGAAIQIAAGVQHTCALLESGKVRCWGDNDNYGQLGYGHFQNIGDNETPATAGDLNIGGPVKQIAAGDYHTCALLTTGNVRCWGYNPAGQLGYANTLSIGGTETPASAGDVYVGGPVKQITAGLRHTCAVLESGGVRCWGEPEKGQLGYANTQYIGDNEFPASAGDVNVGGSVKQISAGENQTCALLDSGNLRCWGYNGSGQLGYGHNQRIGDNETPASAGNVSVGGTVKQISVGKYHTCALFESNKVRCWGSGAFGQLGYGNTQSIGIGSLPSSVGYVNL